MRASRYFIATLKEAPADAEIISHKLMIRAGLIKKLAGGIYNYMPMGLRVIRRIEAIVREEMDRAGAIELLMPVIQPAELWQESGRWQKYGAELMRVKDRNERDFVVQPTSEEAITDIARSEIHSYRQLPKNFYHIQTKFRDERRPRFGIMRGREFTMKDAYSFDRDVAGMKISYQAMYDAYVKVFDRLGLNYRAVEADNGAIGGSGSHEFHVLADSGEDLLAFCPTSDYAANLETAEALALYPVRLPPQAPLAKTATPGAAKCEDVATLLGIALTRTVKAVVVAVARDNASPRIGMFLLRGDHALNEVKAAKVPGFADFRLATEAEIRGAFGCEPGYLGPIKPASHDIVVIADRTVALMSDFVCGANERDFHYTGVNWGRDVAEPTHVADVRDVIAGDPSPDGNGTLELRRGIEVGHVFMLGTRYSEAMKATYLDESGKPQFMIMGCYGIGVTRLVGAAIEQNHDARGIIWPPAIAPFRIVIVALGYAKSASVRAAADALYEALCGDGVDVLLDDRDERPGVLLADVELIGIPHRVVIGDRGLATGKIEVQGRRDATATLIDLATAHSFLKEILA